MTCMNQLSVKSIVDFPDKRFKNTGVSTERDHMEEAFDKSIAGLVCGAIYEKAHSHEKISSL